MKYKLDDKREKFQRFFFSNFWKKRHLFCILELVWTLQGLMFCVKIKFRIFLWLNSHIPNRIRVDDTTRKYYHKKSLFARSLEKVTVPKKQITAFPGRNFPLETLLSIQLGSRVGLEHYQDPCMLPLFLMGLILIRSIRHFYLCQLTLHF